MKSVFKLLLIAALAVGLIAGTALAREVPVPTEDVILTISGVIALHNLNGTFVFDEAMLRALPAISFLVEDPWLGEIYYRGVLLSTLIEYVGFPIAATRVVLIAADDKEIPVAIVNLLHYPIILAFDADGEPIIEAMGGPLKLVFPYCANAFPALEEKYPPEAWMWWAVAIRVEF